MDKLMTSLEECTFRINSAIWGIPLIFSICLVGVIYLLKLRVVNFKNIKRGLHLLLKDDPTAPGKVSRFGAFATSLAAMIGTGNIVGVATAITTGGVGAIFWMAVASFLSMATSYAEGVLSVKYRENGSGGAFLYIKNGLKSGFLAKAFALLCAGSAIIGMGTLTQINSITSAVVELTAPFSITENTVRLICAVVLVILTALIIFGGIERVAMVSSRLIPIIGGLYLLAGVLVIVNCIDKLPQGILIILKSAFTGSAALGGFCGSAVRQSIRMGISRGVFSNEAGLGSATIAHASAKVKSPHEQGLIAMVGTFIDTTLMCTLTGVAIVISGAYETGLDGVALTNCAYSMAFPTVPWLGRGIVSAALILFAFASVIGWNYYGEECVRYLFGEKGVGRYRFIYIVAVSLGAFTTVQIAFNIADILNGLMAIPNLIALFVLKRELAINRQSLV